MSEPDRNSERSTAPIWLALLIIAALGCTAVALAAPASSPRAGRPQVAAGQVPGVITLPSISGSPQVGAALNASRGTWSGSPTAYVYHWQRCNVAGRICAFIAHAASANHTVASADVGGTLRVAVVAVNATGRSKPARSAPTAVVTSGGPQRPKNNTPPQISGLAQVGLTLTATPGSWSENPSRYRYQWLRCDAAGASCGTIEGVISSTYKLAIADLGKTLRVSVTAINTVGESTPARSAPREVVTGAPGARHLEYVFQPGVVHVYSIDEGFAEVESFSLPDSAGVRGVNVCPAKHALYVSYGGDGGGQGTGSVLAYDLVEKKLLWNRSYTNGIDYPALTHDCSRLFEPTGENSGNGVWWILDTATGEQVGKVETTASGPHDTVTSADGTLILLGGHNSNRLPIYSTGKGAVQLYTAALAGGVRPLTIDGADSDVFTTATGFNGFQVSSVKSGEVLYTENFGGTCPGFSTCSHGFSLTPDSREAAVIDVGHKVVQFWDVHGVGSAIAPVRLATVAVAGLSGNESPCVYSCLREGWVQHSYDGRYVFVGDSGDVIESATHRVVGHITPLENSRESIEVDWQRGVPVATSERLGVGRTG